MTVNTQELREAAEAFKQACDDGLFDTEFGTWQALSYEFDQKVSHTVVLALLDEIDRLRARLEFEPAAPEWDGIACRDETIRNLEREIDSLRAELQARQWQPIETCPRRHGKHYLICKDCGPGSLPSISIGFCFDDQKDWHLMDSNCTAEMYGYRVTHWQPLPLPPAPPQGETA